MSNLKLESVDANVFCKEYLSEISISRIYIQYFKRIYLSEVIFSYSVDPDEFINNLKCENFSVEIIGANKTLSFASEGDGKVTERKYFVAIDEKILISVMYMDLRILFDPETPTEKIKKITDIYFASKKIKPKYNEKPEIRTY